jgi:hypothetical protein
MAPRGGGVRWTADELKWAQLVNLSLEAEMGVAERISSPLEAEPFKWRLAVAAMLSNFVVGH